MQMNQCTSSPSSCSLQIQALETLLRSWRKNPTRSQKPPYSAQTDQTGGEEEPFSAVRLSSPLASCHVFTQVLRPTQSKPNNGRLFLAEMKPSSVGPQSLHGPRPMKDCRIGLELSLGSPSPQEVHQDLDGSSTCNLAKAFHLVYFGVSHLQALPLFSHLFLLSPSPLPLFSSASRPIKMPFLYEPPLLL